ncbi:DUF6913 domain-containing protein [Lutibacter holmesii]|uniref:DUF6913 domain-containing protein n=1 Tax=Lutibacter holmesii TaxID=1137985 RepID=A0ABW3WPL3_9FLAO
MIFTGFKRKSAQFFFNKQLQKLLSNNKKYASNKVSSVLVFLDDISEKKSVQESLMETLQVVENQFEFIVFKNKFQKKQVCDACFSPKDFGWSGKVKSEKLNAILTKKYDLLINYSKVENIYRNLLILQTKAAFKVGFSHFDNRLYDLMLEGGKIDIELFNSELKKYLKILNKI